VAQLAAKINQKQLLVMQKNPKMALTSLLHKLSSLSHLSNKTLIQRKRVTQKREALTGM
jgi:hypothetical protein